MIKHTDCSSKSIHLSRRMAALVRLVTPGNRLADVGCDHAYIPVYLCRSEIIPSAIAMDVNEGPLGKANEHIAAHGMEARIQTRLSDGLKELFAGEADTILIAGMGGYLMTRILSEGAHVLDSVSELILQPQSDIAMVRCWLAEHGFAIIDEDMVEEDKQFYPMMKAQRRIGMDTDLPDGDLKNAFGPILLARRHPVLKKWLEKEREKTVLVLAQLKKDDGRALNERRDGESPIRETECQSDRNEMPARRQERYDELSARYRCILAALTLWDE